MILIQRIYKHLTKMPWSSIDECATALGTTPNSISCACRTGQTTFRKMKTKAIKRVWKLAEERTQ